jgi:class 3 adenylate cyclase/tetratricopeptide (TPR) repeat protein
MSMTIVSISLAMGGHRTAGRLFDATATLPRPAAHRYIPTGPTLRLRPAVSGMRSEGGSSASERHDATVVVADISGFTALSETLDPEAVTDLMNRCFATLEVIVTSRGGIVDQYIGDCVVAVFGLDDSGPDATRRAVGAASEMRTAIHELNQEGHLPAALDLHVGIATGPVVAGQLGGELSRAFRVTGETVHLAELVEHASEAGDVFVCPRTHAETAQAFEYRALEPRVLAPGQEAMALNALVVAVRPRRRVKRPSERRQATVLFADVRGFKALYATMAPDALTTMLNRCFAELELAVRSYGGVIDKYVGECVMALFGVPNAIEHAPRQAINAAIEIRRRLAELNAEARLATPLVVHIGINTGLVIAGEIGGRAKRDFTVMGDTVNLAARLRDAAPAGAVWVGPETHRATAAEFEYRALAPLKLKGKAQLIHSHELQSSESQVHRTPRAPVADRLISSAVVGRETEIAELETRIRQLVEGTGGMVGVVGEAGLGKSRLLAELLARASAADVTVLEGRSMSIGQGLSFHPFVDLLRRWARISEKDGDDAGSAKLLAAIGEIMPDDERDEVFPFVATLMGMRPGGGHADRVGGLEGEAVEELILKSMRQLFLRLADQRPTVVVFEDLHWADLSSIELLESLLRLVVRHRLLFVAVARPDFPETSERILAAARTEYATAYTEIRLGQLTDPQCDALIQNLLGSTDLLPYATRALIVRKADGNPFYIEEVIRSLIDQGAVVYVAGHARLTEKIHSVVIPGTVQEVIMTRVDRLDEATRHVLQVASVIGRSFQHSIVADILGDVEDLDAILDDLMARQLVQSHQSRRTANVRRVMLFAEREYLFTHALLQETIYEAILQKTRQALHRRVARSIEATYADRLADFYSMLAYHDRRGEENEKAEEYLFKAGEEAARSAASNEALAFFRDASRLYLQMHGDGGDRRKRALLEQNIGSALLLKGSLTEAIEHFDSALALLGEPVPNNKIVAYSKFALDLAGVMGQLFVRTGRRRVVADWDRERQISEIYFNRGRAEITSDPTRLFIDLVGAFRRFNRIDMRQIDQASAMYASFATMFCYSGVSFAVSKRALAIAKGLIRPGNVRDVFTCASMEFIHHYLRGDWDDVHVIDDGLVEEALRYGQLWDVNTYVGLFCDQRLRQGDFATARELLARLADISDSYGYAFAEANHDGMTALCLLEKRDLGEALRAADKYYGERHEDALRVLGLGVRAKAQVLLGDSAGAEATLATAETITSRSIEVPPWQLSAYAAARLRHDVMALEQAAGRGGVPSSLARRARKRLRYALRIASKVSIQRTEIHQLAGRACWLLGRPREALRHWSHAVAVGTRMGTRPELARTYAEAGRSFLEAPGAHRLDGLDGAACLARAIGVFRELELEWDLERYSDAARAASAAA